MPYTPKQAFLILSLCQKHIDPNEPKNFREGTENELVKMYLAVFSLQAHKSTTKKEFLNGIETLQESLSLKQAAEIAGIPYQPIKSIKPHESDIPRLLSDKQLNSEDWSIIVKMVMRDTELFPQTQPASSVCYQNLKESLKSLAKKILHTQNLSIYSETKDKDENIDNIFLLASEEQKEELKQIIMAFLHRMEFIGCSDSVGALLKFLSIAQETNQANTFEPGTLAVTLSPVLAQALNLEDCILPQTNMDGTKRTDARASEYRFFQLIADCCLDIPTRWKSLEVPIFTKNIIPRNNTHYAAVWHHYQLTLLLNMNAMLETFHPVAPYRLDEFTEKDVVKNFYNFLFYLFHVDANDELKNILTYIHNINDYLATLPFDTSESDWLKAMGENLAVSLHLYGTLIDGKVVEPVQDPNFDPLSAEHTLYTFLAKGIIKYIHWFQHENFENNLFQGYWDQERLLKFQRYLEDVIWTSSASHFLSMEEGVKTQVITSPTISPVASPQSNHRFRRRKNSRPEHTKISIEELTSQVNDLAIEPDKSSDLSSPPSSPRVKHKERSSKPEKKQKTSTEEEQMQNETSPTPRRKRDMLRRRDTAPEILDDQQRELLFSKKEHSKSKPTSRKHRPMGRWKSSDELPNLKNSHKK